MSMSKIQIASLVKTIRVLCQDDLRALPLFSWALCRVRPSSLPSPYVRDPFPFTKSFEMV